MATLSRSSSIEMEPDGSSGEVAQFEEGKEWGLVVFEMDLKRGDTVISFYLCWFELSPCWTEWKFCGLSA